MVIASMFDSFIMIPHLLRKIRIPTDPCGFEIIYKKPLLFVIHRFRLNRELILKCRFYYFNRNKRESFKKFRSDPNFFIFLIFDRKLYFLNFTPNTLRKMKMVTFNLYTWKFFFKCSNSPFFNVNKTLRRLKIYCR